MSKPELEAALKNYKYFPNICAIGIGTKFTNGEAVPGVTALQFFVTEKVPEPELRRVLPEFVYSRKSDGSIDTTNRIQTDVIELKNLRLCCRGGDGLSVVGVGDGATTLIFSNGGDASQRMMLTCAHVVSADLSQPWSGAKKIRGGSDYCLFQATVRHQTHSADGRLEFDIALGDMVSDDNPVERGIRGTELICDGFVDLVNLPDHTVLSGAFPRTPGPLTLVSRSAEYKNVSTRQSGEITIANLYACRGEAIEGDSGGLVHIGPKAAGMLVAKADDGWLFIHALREATAYLSQNSGVAVLPFPKA